MAENDDNEALNANVEVRQLRSHTAKLSQDPPIPSDESDVPVSQESEVNSADEPIAPPQKAPRSVHPVKHLKTIIQKLETTAESKKATYEKNIARRDETIEKMETLHEKSDATLRDRIATLQAKVRGSKDEIKAKIAANELVWKARVDTAEGEVKIMGDHSKEKVKNANSRARQARTEATKSQKPLVKADEKYTTTKRKIDELTHENDTLTATVKKLKAENKRINSKLKTTSKKMDNQLAMKLVAKHRKAELDVEKQRISLETAKEKKSQRQAIIEFQHNKKVDFHEIRLKGSTAMAKKKAKIKSEEKQANIAQSVSRITSTNGLHTGQFPNAGGGTLGGVQTIQQVSRCVIICC